MRGCDDLLGLPGREGPVAYPGRIIYRPPQPLSTGWPVPGSAPRAGTAARRRRKRVAAPCAYNWQVLFGSRTSVSLDASQLFGMISPRAKGGGEPGPALRMALEPGSLVPSATEANLVRPAAVKAALADLLDRLGRPPRVVAILPLGIARMSLLEPPAGTDPRGYARFRLGPRLPFPADEAIVDAVAAGEGRVLAGAVRRLVVAEYEELFATCGTTAERVDLAPLAAIEARRREGTPPSLDLFLGDVAFAIALHDGGVLRSFHCRRRVPGPSDLDRLARVLAAVARREGGAVAPRVVVFGEGSSEVVTGLLGRGFLASSGSDRMLLGSAA